MAVTRRPAGTKDKPVRPPARTPKQIEDELISATYELARQQIADKSVSSQTMSHFLKMGSSREEAERKKLESENALLKARVDNLQSMVNSESLAAEAIAAFRAYAGAEQVVEEFDEE